MDTRTPRTRRFPGEVPLPPAERLSPALDLAVVEWLERLAPEVRMPGHDAASLAFAHGRRDMALHVRAEYNRQQQKDA